MNKNVTWGGRFQKMPASLMQLFSESVSFDWRLASFDIFGSQAHAQMLCHVGIITKKECDLILAGLKDIEEEITRGIFQWDKALEDVHMNIEYALTQRVPAAAKLHTARSRNDQIATDMRLFFKSACDHIRAELKSLLGTLIDLSEKNIEIIIPGYTHLQRAQPVSMAHHLLAYVEMFGRDLRRFDAVWESANVCPLGSGAIAGTTLPIDRPFVAKLLGFVDKQGNPKLTHNSMDAVSDRDVFVDFAHACAMIGIHWSRLAEDVILWNSTEFGWVKLPDAFTTGSSLMPQKKNPDSLELLRGKAARLQGNLQTLFTLIKGLPLTYNRDLQEDKIPIFDSYDQVTLGLAVLRETLSGMEVNRIACRKAVEDPALLATDLVDYLVERGIPFRDAHHKIGALIALSESKGVKLNELSLKEAQSICNTLESDWKNVFNVEEAIQKRNKTGMPSFDCIRLEISQWKEWLLR